MAKRRILLGVTDAFSLRLMKGLPERLLEAGWDVHIVSGGGPHADVYRDIPVTMHEIAMVRRPSLVADLGALISWIKLLKRLAPDIIFSGTPKAGMLGILSSWVNRVPHRIYHLRGLRLETTHGFARVLYWGIERLTFLLSTRAIAVSQSLMQQVIALKLVSPKKITVLASGSSNGVDVARFSPCHSPWASYEEFGLSPEVPVIGFVGRVSKDKGSEELARASRILSERGMEHQILIVGPREDEGDPENVFAPLDRIKPVFTGTVPDTAPYYQLMDVLCLPTHREGFPNVVLEAGASGIATVTTNATGAVDSVIEGITGRVVPVGNSDELAKVLSYLIVNPRERERMGKAARKYIEKTFNQEAVQNELLHFFETQLTRL